MSKNETISLVQGDITKQEVDVIVNAANAQLAGGGGVDGAIHRAAGLELLAAGQKIYREHGPLPTGQAVITTGGQLPCQVIHTVGPIWRNHEPAEADRLLADCYRNSLDLAREEGLFSIAFPNISTGVYGFPKDRAAPLVVSTLREYLHQHPDHFQEIRLVCFDAENFRLYKKALST